MNKTDEAAEKAIKKVFDGWLLRFFRTTTTVCITATAAVIGGLYSFGMYLYNNSNATRAAIDTFIEVKKHHDKF